MSVKIPFFPLLLRYLKILGFNLHLMFAEQKSKKYLCFSPQLPGKRSPLFAADGEQERRDLLSTAASPGPGAEAAVAGKRRLEQPLLLFAP